jgi:hypothetical protein
MWNNTISFYFFSKRMEKISLERSHKGKRHLFLGFFTKFIWLVFNIKDLFIYLFIFQSVKLCSLKALNFGF